MEGYNGQFICILIFYRAVSTILLIWICSIGHMKLDKRNLDIIFGATVLYQVRPDGKQSLNFMIKN